MQQLEERCRTEAQHLAVRRDAGNARAAAVARCDHDIEAAIECGEHPRELARMVGVVAIHDEQHVVRGAVLRRVRNEAAQSLAQTLC